MANKALVQHFCQPSPVGAIGCDAQCGQLNIASQTGGGASSSRQTDLTCWTTVREKFLSEGFDASTVNILLHSLKVGTRRCYATYLKRWFSYCEAKSVSVLSPHISQVLTFLSFLVDQGGSYGQLCMARSALSLLLSPCGSDLSWGRMPIVKRYIKGVFEQKPVLPKVYTIWDVRDVFDYIRSLPTPRELTLKVLSHNLALLLGLLSGGQRC